MASIIQIGDKHRAQIRRKGQPTITKTFTSSELAQDWAKAQEASIKSSKAQAKTGVTLAQAIQRYREESKELGKTASDVLGYLAEGMGHLHLDKLTDDDIVVYIKGKKFSAATGAMHFSFLCSVLKMAKVGWKYQVPEILDIARERLVILELIGESEERKRRPTKKEIDLLLTYEFPTPIPMADIIRFAMSSAMRQAEITRIKHATFDEQERTVVITDRKHPKKKKGNHKVVPLTAESMAIIKRQSRVEGDDNIFPFNPRTIGQYFTDACKALGIHDLRFHDLRHEGTSRLFEMGYQIQQVAMFTGHEDWKMLKRYTQLQAKDLPRMDAVEGKTEVSAVMDGETMERFRAFMEFEKMIKHAA